MPIVSLELLKKFQGELPKDFTRIFRAPHTLFLLLKILPFCRIEPRTWNFYANDLAS